jgi:hypothetical protein
MTCREAFAKAEELIGKGVRVKVGADKGQWYCVECAK